MVCRRGICAVSADRDHSQDRARCVPGYFLQDAFRQARHAQPPARLNETFADKSSALRIFSSYLLSLQHPVGESDWFAYLSDQPYFNLKVDGTGRQAGFYLNKTTLGIGRTIALGMVATLGYELSETNVQGGHDMRHTFLLGLDIHFN